MTAAARMAVRVLITGRVQGVWFRGWTVERAHALGLSGWVRNRLDGAVEAVFAGPPAAVAAMIAACHQGPPAAQVSTLTQEPAEDPGPAAFQQRPTAS